MLLFYHNFVPGGIDSSKREVTSLFIMTTKLTKAKAVGAILIGGALLCGLIFAAGHLHQEDQSRPSPQNVSDNDGRVAYLSGWGWEVNPSAVETLDLVLPEALSDSYASYNALQAENGLDLTAYCGKRVKRYTYNVLNYPKDAEGVQANLYLCGDTVIAGDIMASGQDGFISSLQYPV